MVLAEVGIHGVYTLYVIYFLALKPHFIKFIPIFLKKKKEEEEMCSAGAKNALFTCRLNLVFIIQAPLIYMRKKNGAG